MKATIKCPKCSAERSEVVDSRGTSDGDRVRRRRKCLQCSERFTTAEYVISDGAPILTPVESAWRVRACVANLNEELRTLAGMLDGLTP